MFPTVYSCTSVRMFVPGCPKTSGDHITLGTYYLWVVTTRLRMARLHRNSLGAINTRDQSDGNNASTDH